MQPCVACVRWQACSRRRCARLAGAAEHRLAVAVKLAADQVGEAIQERASQRRCGRGGGGRRGGGARARTLRRQRRHRRRRQRRLRLLLTRLAVRLLGGVRRVHLALAQRPLLAFAPAAPIWRARHAARTHATRKRACAARAARLPLRCAPPPRCRKVPAQHDDRHNRHHLRARRRTRRAACRLARRV